MFTFDTENGLCHNDKDPNFVTQGYSGIDDGLLNPSKQSVKYVGPIPRFRYIIKEVDFSPLTDNTKQMLTTAQLTHLKNLRRLGPVIFELFPDPTFGNWIFESFGGRGGFFIHWDTNLHKMIASDGCIIFYWQWVFDYITKAVRGGDNILQVI